MAVANEIPMLVDLYKNNNTESKGYGMYYGRVFPRDGLTLKGFAKHLSEHGKLASYEMLVLVLQNAVSCMRHLLLEGVPIKLDGLGTFKAGIEGTGAATIADYRADHPECAAGPLVSTFAHFFPLFLISLLAI